MILSFVFISFGCQKKVYDTRVLSDNEFTFLNTSAVDALGRVSATADGIKKDKDRYVGLFYFTWLGQHQGAGRQTGIYDITQLLEYNPDALWDTEYNEFSPVGSYHLWGEPLFGYYNSLDPWVVNRHIEMLTSIGIDFLVFDATNAVSYDNVYKIVLKTLNSYQQQGFNVPKVIWYTSSSSKNTVWHIYDNFYNENANIECRYPKLWFSINGKPMIIGDKWNFEYEGEEAEKDQWLINEYFDFKQKQWPDKTNNVNGFPWISFEYPQFNHDGIVSVSVAQHTSVKMSNQSVGNWGRGFDRDTMQNDSLKSRSGLNYQSQWDTVFNYEKEGIDVNIAFLTGWNEWTAIKFTENISATEKSVFFVDTFNEEYSRDIEPMKGGYGDNFYLQTMQNIRKYKYTDSINYVKELNTFSLNSFEEWNVNKYIDYCGDAIERDYMGFHGSVHYSDNSNRNDISNIQVANDKDYLYMKIMTVDNITTYNGIDTNWMNILIGTDKGNEKFGDYNYIINRYPEDNKTSIEKCTGGFNFSNTGQAEFNINDNIMIVKIPLESLGFNNSNISIKFKVCDNITNPSDIMDYYVSGDSAPIGRLSFNY